MENISGAFEELVKWQSSIQAADFVATKDKTTIIVIITVFLAVLLPAFKWNKSVNVPYSYITGTNYFDHLLEPLRLLKRTKEAAVQGYKMFPNSFFRLPLYHYPKGLVVVDRAHLKEFYNAPNETFSFRDALNAQIDIRYTLPAANLNQYHIDVVRNQLTQNLASLTPYIAEEIKATLSDELDPKMKDDWTPIMVYPFALALVSRTTYRAFTGPELCRNKDFLNEAVYHATEVNRVGELLTFYPEFLRPLVYRFYRKFHETEATVAKHLKPIIEKRLNSKTDEEYTDLIQWLLDSAPTPEDAKPDRIIARVMALNFAGIHTSSMSFTHALYDLTTYPQHIPELREEIDALVAENGWQKSTLMKMKKLDSFVKESLRMNMVSGVGSHRKALRPFTFSNGVKIPAGQYVAVPTSGIHMDETVYEDAEKFDGFRFSKMREREGENAKHYSVNTGMEFLTFGHGKHACPGRFFAVNEVKLMIAFVLKYYDVEAEQVERPKNSGTARSEAMPNKSANILFRARQVV